MKKLGFIITLILTVSLPLFAEHVDPETARKVATTFLNNNGAKTTQLTDLSKAAGFPNLYIFNGEEGFVILSADNCVKPVLGYSLTNHFVAENMPDNLKWWLQGYDESIAESIKHGEKTTEETRQSWVDLLSGKMLVTGEPNRTVAPLISTSWHQDPPFNNLCPANTVTGCVATAMAQVMKKWNYPETGIGSHSYHWNGDTYSVDFGSTNYDWANMKNSYSESYSSTEATAVATLLYHCGVSVEMKYVPYNESSSNIERASHALATYFNYTSTYIKKAEFEDDASWISRIKEDLDQGLPTLYGGSRENSNQGHAFVCDGYDSNDYLHFNWGWSSGAQGYYSVAKNGHSFTRNQCAVVNIRPINSLAEKPTDLSCNNPNGHQVTLSWNPGNNAASYNIYRNNTRIANSTSTAFIDNNPSVGSNYYYIRSLDNTGCLSLPSNTFEISVSFSLPSVDHLTAQNDNDAVLLSWQTPWWHPQNDVGVLAYTTDERPNLDSYITWNVENAHLYWGIRHLSADLTAYQGKALFKTSFYTFYPGNYKVLIYQGTQTDDDYNYPDALLAEKAIHTARIGWVDVYLDDPVFITDQDLWVFIYDEDGKFLWLPCNDNQSCNGEGQYYWTDLGEGSMPPNQGCNRLPTTDIKIDWFIRSFLTDETYTYNLYQNGTKIAQDLSATTYNATLNNNATNLFTVKTNYYGGESTASNVAGITKGSASLASLDIAANDMLTIAPNSTLTVTGSLTNTNADNLIIEDGAQLINESTGVKATVKKNITAYTSGADGWNFIASPVTETLIASEITGLITTDTYDFYYLDEGSEKWINYKDNNQHTNIGPGFDIQSKKGYLYANSVDNTIEFEGTLQQNGSVSLAMTNNGWNLIGNPFTCDAYASQSFYRIVNGALDANIKDNTTSIPPCTGILVKATSDKATFTFSKTAPVASTNNGNLKIALTQATTTHMGTRAETLDKAFVSFNEGSELGKFYLGLQNANIYIPQNGEAYTIAYSEQQGEMPLCFKANQDGNYTITVNAENVNIGYLHLIDNIAGNDVDLIATPSYTFSANADDHESRFRLIFSANENTNSDTTDIMDGVTHILDVTGRIVATDLNAKLTLASTS